MVLNIMHHLFFSSHYLYHWNFLLIVGLVLMLLELLHSEDRLQVDLEEHLEEIQDLLM